MNEPANNTARPRTSLGEQLTGIRDRIVESGARLLSSGEIEQEIARRRGEAEAKVRLRETVSSMQRDAAERGLAETELQRLMADEN
jgi:hypothetical protein